MRACLEEMQFRWMAGRNELDPWAVEAGMNRSRVRVAICSGLVSLALAATAQAQIIGVRAAAAPSTPSTIPVSAPSTSPSSGPTVMPAAPPASSFQDPMLIDGPAITGDATSAAEASLAPPPGTSAAEQVPLSISNSPSMAPLAPEPFNPGDTAWGVPGTRGQPNWDALMAPTTTGPPPTTVNPPGLYQPYTPPGGGFLGGGGLRMLLLGNGSAPGIGFSGSRDLFAGWTDWAPPAADRQPCWGFYAFEAFETWRNIPDGNTRPHGNNGSVTGFNAAVPVVEEYGIGAQFGMSYGAYGSTADTQQQVFITTGIFRRADFDKPGSFGLVYDQMINQGLGAYQQSPALGQLRLHLAYAFTARNEIGFWGALRLGEAARYDATTNTEIIYRGVSQGDVFWHHKFGPGNTDGWVWAGIPSFYRLNGDNDFETNIYGFRTETPLGDRVKLFSNFQGLRPTGGVSHHAIYNFMVGLSFYPQGNARSTTVAGRAWMPYVPVANNSSFLIDTNQTF